MPAAGAARARRDAGDVDHGSLHGKPLVLHLAAPAAPGPTPPAALVLYASGDGGWFGTAVQMFHALAAGGQPAVGLSSRAFLKIERPGRAPAEPGAAAPRLRGHPRSRAAGARAAAADAGDPDRLVARRGVRGPRRRRAARRRRRRPAWSRSASPTARTWPIDGPEDETRRRATRSPAARASGRGRSRPTTTLAHGVDTPAAVVQATGDGYLPAAQARALFGADGPARRFFEVPGRNHRFDGAGRELVTALSQALQWIVAGVAARRRLGVARRSAVVALAARAGAGAGHRHRDRPRPRPDRAHLRRARRPADRRDQRRRRLDPSRALRRRHARPRAAASSSASTPAPT